MKGEGRNGVRVTLDWQRSGLIQVSPSRGARETVITRREKRGRNQQVRTLGLKAGRGGTAAGKTDQTWRGTKKNGQRMANYCGTTHLSEHIWYPPPLFHDVTSFDLFASLPPSRRRVPPSLSLITALAAPCPPLAPRNGFPHRSSTCSYPRWHIPESNSSPDGQVANAASAIWPETRRTRGNNSRKVSRNWHARGTSPWIERGCAEFHIFFSWTALKFAGAPIEAN